MSRVHTLTKLLERVIGTADEGKVRAARDRAISEEAEAESRPYDEIVMAKRDHLRVVKPKPPTPVAAEPISGSWQIVPVDETYAEIQRRHQSQL